MKYEDLVQNRWGYDGPISAIVGFNLLSIETLWLTVLQVDSMIWFVSVLTWLFGLLISLIVLSLNWGAELDKAYFRITKWIWITTFCGLALLIWVYPWSVFHLMDWSDWFY